jgi:AraC-like DNA-binding protein
MTRQNCCAHPVRVVATSTADDDSQLGSGNRVNYARGTRTFEKGMLHGKVTDPLVHHPIPVSREDNNLCHTMVPDVRPQSGRKNVNCRLDRVKDWPAVATKAGFKIGRMAKEKKVSVRNLHRFVRGRFGKSPKRWIDELRAAHAAAGLAVGQSAKAITIAVKYAHESSFCRFFKRVTGSTTRNHADGAWMSEKANECPQKVSNGRFS